MTTDNEPRMVEAYPDWLSDLNNIVRALEDEGDRVYLGSTNDADRLWEVVKLLEQGARHRIATEDACRAREAELAVMLLNLVGAIDELIANSDGVVGLYLESPFSKVTELTPWKEITDGGVGQDWLIALEDARLLLNARAKATTDATGEG